MLLAAGVKLGPYEILEPIGAGGMGESTAFTNVGKSTTRACQRYSHETSCHPGYTAGPSERTGARSVSMDRSDAPAMAALVACPARREWPAYLAGSRPARAASFLVTRATSIPDKRPAGLARGD
jgi:hypothetical protein